ncbi:MAG: carboxypeptidase regulatory-like domain-containing protein, partial [Myxococcota bacterium]|nr:carboxypeptidase regulatory-like domain-containing protein [Myxococcota bacterium]
EAHEAMMLASPSYAARAKAKAKAKPKVAPKAAAAAAPAAAAPAAAPAGGYEGMDAVADGGTVNGTISYSGDQTDPQVDVGKDSEVCRQTDGKREGGILVVADGKLANAVVELTGITKGKNFEVGSIDVDNIECLFVPHVSLGQKGGKVLAKNSDAVLHNTNLTQVTPSKKSIGNSALPTQGATAEKTLKKAGLVEISCDAHEWMSAYIYVTDHPYAAITGADGAFSMADVPAGTYTAKVWHESLGEKEAEVTVEAGGTATLDLAFEGATASAE